MKKIYYLIILLVPVFFPAPAQAVDNNKVLEFFFQYVTLSTSFDASVAQLYSDDARVRAFRRTEEGLVPYGEMTGIQMKEMIEKIMPMARDLNDISKFSNLKITAQGDVVKIKADRYSVLKCFTDTGYYMLIKENQNNEFQIIEEQVETQQFSDCEGAKNVKNRGLQLLLQKSEDQLKGLLPMMLDDDTRLESVNVQGSTFQYQYSLVNLASEEVGARQVELALLPVVRNQACTLPDLRAMIDEGATISFLYRGKNGKEIIVLNVTKKECR